MATIIHVTKSGRKTPIFTLAKGDARTKRVQFVIPRDDAEVPLDELTWRISITNAEGEQDGTALPKEVHGDHIDLWWTCGYITANAVGLTTIYLNAFNEDGKMQWSSGEYCIHVIPAKEDEQEEGNGLSELQELIESARQAMENATQETIAATQSAIAAADSANEAANTAEKAAENAEDAADGANDSAIRADEAAESADNAKEDANTAAVEAQQAANTANTAANNANQAANAANTAAEAANNARLAIADELNKKASAIPVDASGDMVHITDGAEGIPVQSLITHVEPVQEGSGDPSPDNVRPISGWDSVSVTCTGKNLFGGEALADRFESVMTVTRDDEARTISFGAKNASGKVFFTDFNPGTRYTIILYGRNGTGVTNTYIRYTDGTTGKIQFVESATDCYAVYTTVAGKSVEAFMGSYSNGTTVLYYDKCGIFEGVLTEADFAEYQGKTLTAELPETLYGFDINWTTGLVTVDRKQRQINQASTLYNFPGDGHIGGQITVSDMRLNSRANGMCDKLTPVASPSNQAKPCITFGANSKLIYFILPSTVAGTTLETLNAYLAENPLTVVYPLENPYTIQIEPQQLETLKGTNNIWSNAGATEVTYAADTKLYIDNKIAAIAAAIVNG